MIATEVDERESILEMESKIAKEAAVVVDDPGNSREERVYRMWINSLNIDNVYVNDLYSDADDGLTLLKLYDKLALGSVEWKK